VLLGREEAMKIFSIRHLQKNSTRRQDFYNEFNVPFRAKDLGLENLIHLKEVVFDEEFVGIVLPKYSMDLQSYFEQTADRRNDLYLFQQMLLAIQQMNFLGLSHRDVKPKNFVAGPGEAEARPD